MVDSGKFSNFYGVDMYADTHDTEEYKSALLTVGLLKKYKLFRMTFDDAIDLFEDASFDFIYIDGDHSTKAVMEDFLLVLPLVKKGGNCI